MEPSSTEPVEPLTSEERFNPFDRMKGPLWPMMVVAGLIMMAGIAAVSWFVPLPYYALWPGPVEEVSDLVQVDGGPPVYELNGDLYMLTVSLEEVNAFGLAQGWIDPTVDVVAREVIRPHGVNPEDHRRENLRLMDDSKDTAIAVALDYLGMPVEYSGDGVLVVSVGEGTPADGLLEVGDVIVKVGETGVSMREGGIEAILSNEIGDTVPLTVQRADEEMEIDITLVEHKDDPGRPMVGFVPRTYNRSLELPFEIDIDTHGIGGPSAGVMYTLTLIDLLTEDDLLAGNIVAGTGTISQNGQVGAIGGVRQKVVAAQNAGALYILVPEDNYSDAITVKRDNVEIYGVSSIGEAIEVLEGITGP